ncbi:MAG: 4-hydroxy-tetrahydrodipicolinate reductase [Rhodospirillales bacterium]|nr:4-hydroxy-tetrahydrodipicolinate reductase [Rhodospirillales bacterium]
MKIGIIGCAGRMGRMLVAQVLETNGAELAGGSEAKGHAALGKDVAGQAGLAPLGLQITDDAAAVLAASDVVIEFSLPGPTLEHVALAGAANTPMVIGTTGFDEGQEKAFLRAAEKLPVVWASNYSIGVTVLMAATKRFAATLDEEYDIEIFEMHHKHKVDAPSGTALSLGLAAAEGRGVKLPDVQARGRDGISGERVRGQIGFASLRGGDVVGEHSVIFAGAGERVELSHKATSRVIFAAGAVRAALWLPGKTAGLYGMNDVLGLED